MPETSSTNATSSERARRLAIWPYFRAEHVLFEDDDLIFVHKPSGVPSQAAQAERPDDLVLRLRRFLAARDDKPEGAVYLGVHQRLDRDTSGVLLFTKRADVNAKIAAQIEDRRVKKRYRAAVTGWSKTRQGQTLTLTNELAKGEDGTMFVVPPPKKGQRASGKKGTRAVTHVTLSRANGERALVDLLLETGRTHQARVQLAHAGLPIAGDPLYRGAPATRLLLHAASLEIEHPRTGKRLVVRDDLDREEMKAWLEHGALGFAIYDDRASLDRALAVAVERRWGLGHACLEDDARRTTAFRLVNEEGDALPGLAVDVYGDHLVAQIYAGEEWDKPARRDRVLDALDALGFAGVYLKIRPKQANVLVDTRRDDVAPREPVRGVAVRPEDEKDRDRLVIHEEGVPFDVRLGDGLSTGIFLDQRRNRRAVREIAKGKRVANLFSYTCAFSIVAAVGGAVRTASVDASLAALERGREGFLLAGTGDVRSNKRHRFVGEDVFSWLAKTAKKAIAGDDESLFDLVIVDPPSYSSTKKRRFVAESDYGELIAMAAAIVAPRGQILACCNHRGMHRQKLRRLIHEGAREAKREVAQLKDMPDGEDFPGALGRDPHMKSALLTLR